MYLDKEWSLYNLRKYTSKNLEELLFLYNLKSFIDWLFAVLIYPFIPVNSEDLLKIFLSTCKNAVLFNFISTILPLFI